MTVVFVSLLLTGLAYAGSSHAQIKEDEVDFEVLATVTMKEGDNLWDLATKYYGDPFQWPLIKDMNKIPSEGAIPIGTVVYLPVIPIKRTTVEEVEPEVSEVEKLSAEIEKLRNELRSVKGKNKECEDKNKQLAEALKDKDAAIKDLSGMLDNVKTALDRMKAESELEAQAREMRAAAQEAAKKDKDKLSDAVKSKDRYIQELESKLKQCTGDLETARAELRARPKIVVEEKPPTPVKKAAPGDKSKIAALAAALIGSIVWIASD